MSVSPELTDDAFLGGKLQVLQPKKGYRAAMDAVLLAAAISARKGDRILDVGAGVGVISLCLARRMTGVQVLGLEKQAHLVDLAAQNIVRNDLPDIEVMQADLFAAPKTLERNSFDWVVSNPPYYEAGRGRPSPDASRRGSHIMNEGEGVESWLAAAIKFVRPLGRFAVVYPAEDMHKVISSVTGSLGDLKIFPLWPGAGKPARRVIIIGTKGAKGGMALLPGLVLHAEGRRYSETAERILKVGEGLVI